MISLKNELEIFFTDRLDFCLKENVAIEPTTTINRKSNNVNILLVWVRRISISNYIELHAVASWRSERGERLTGDGFELRESCNGFFFFAQAKKMRIKRQNVKIVTFKIHFN